MTTTPIDSLDLAPLARLQWQSLTLWERLEVAGDPGLSGQKEAIARLLEKWTRAFSPDNPEALLNRLRWDDLDEEALVAVVSPRPVEADRLSGIVDFLGEVTDLRATEEWAEPNDPIRTRLPFASIWLSMALPAIGRVDYPPALTAAARRDLEVRLLRDLLEVGGSSLYELFDQARSEAGDFDPHGSELIENFASNLSIRRLRPFFFRYPVAARRLAETALQWVETTTELIRRLSIDIGRIEEMVGPTGGEVTGIETALSDRHAGGRRVMRLTFASGVAVIYKPRDVSLTAWYNSFLRALRDGGLPDAPPDMRMIVRDGYGWIENLVNAGNVTRPDSWFRRAGSLAFVTYLLHGRDLHMENVIATDEGPVLIDAEALLQPTFTWDQVESRTALDEGRAVVRRSVLATGLVTLEIEDATGRVFEISGLRGEGGDLSSVRANRWTGVNRNDIRRIEVEVEGEPADNLPRIDGEIARLEDHADAFIEGFTGAHRFVRSNSGKIRELIGESAGLQVRVVLRPSSQYATLFDRLVSARYSHEGLTGSILCDALNRRFAGLPEPPQAWPLIVAERDALRRLDIPLILVTTDARGDDRIVSENGLAKACAALDSLSEESLRREVGLLRGALGSRTPAEHEQSHSKDEPLRAIEPESARIRDAVESIAEMALDIAFAGRDGTTIWMLPGLLTRRGAESRGEGFYLYRGLSGVALFLLAAGRVSGNERATAAASGAIAVLQELTRDPRLDSLIAAEPLGGINGFGSIVWTLTTFAALTGDEASLIDAERLVAAIPRARIETDARLDLEGGAAGLLLVCIALHETSGSEVALEVARACGERLIRSAGPVGSGVGWTTGGGRHLAGLAHGNAGIALALARLSCFVENRDLPAVIEGALRRERELFDGRRWCVGVPGGTASMNAWCHGAAGIGIARIAMRSTAVGAALDLDDEITAAITAIREDGSSAVNQLCCGNAGRLETLTEAELAGVDAASGAANDLAGRIVANLSRNGDESDAPASRLSLFRGVSGIGWALARRLDATLPSPLTLAERRE